MNAHSKTPPMNVTLMHPTRTLMGVTPATAMLDVRAMDSIVQVKYLCRELAIYQLCNFHLDIDESRSNDERCQHNCHNTVVSYRCSCRAGYRLSSVHRCEGNEVHVISITCEYNHRLS